MAVIALLWTVQPTLANLGFALSMGVLGIGMGLIVSQLGNVVQSSVDASGRGEAGGLQYTGQQLGSSPRCRPDRGAGPRRAHRSFIAKVESDTRISSQVSAQVGVAAGSGLDFVSSDQIATSAQKAGLDADTTAALVDDYEQAQLGSLKAGLLAAAVLALISLGFTGELPHGPPGQPAPGDDGSNTDSDAVDEEATRVAERNRFDALDRYGLVRP